MREIYLLRFYKIGMGSAKKWTYQIFFFPPFKFCLVLTISFHLNSLNSRRVMFLERGIRKYIPCGLLLGKKERDPIIVTIPNQEVKIRTHSLGN